MREEEVLRLVNGGEGPTVEFKREFTTEIARDIAAFANCGGGSILIGVNDEAAFVGVEENPRRVEERVMGLCAHAVKPSLTVQVELINVEKVEVVVVSVPDGDRKPYTANDICYVRAGSTSRRAAPDELRRLSLEAEFTAFERIPLADRSFEDLDVGRLEAYIQRRAPGAILIDGLHLRDVAVTLGMAVRRGDRVLPTVAGMILFGRHPQWIRPEWGIGAARIAGKELADPIADRADVEGTADELVEGVLQFVRRNMRIAAVFDPDDPARRKDIPEYPLLAVREALVNAVAHRDYSASGRITLRMFEDRLEITSPGGLPKGVSVEELLRRGGSYPRNPTILRTLREWGLAEEIGRGLIRIRREMTDLGSEEPLFQVSPVEFSITLPSSHRALPGMRPE